MANLITTVEQAKEAGAYDAEKGQGAYKSAPITPVKSQTINSSALVPTTPIVPTKVPPPTAGIALQGTIESQAKQYADSIVSDNALLQSKGAKDKALTDLSNKVMGSKGQTALTDEYYRREVDPAKKELDDINNQILAEQHSLRRRQEALDKNPEGFFGGGLEQEKRRIENESISKQADLSIIQMAKQNNYFGAKEIADRKVAAQLESDATEIKMLELTYNENKELFTKQEQRQFETQQAERVRLLQKEGEELKAVNNIAIEALQNGAPTDLVRRMQQATTQADAIAIGGQYIGLLDRQSQQLDAEYKRAQINKIRQEAVAEAAGGDTEDLAAYASQYADTGKLPSPSELKLAGLSVGQVTSFAKQMPKTNGALLSSNTGAKLSSLSPAQEDGMLALYDITQKTQQLKELDDARFKGLTSATLGKVFGSADQQRYIDLRGEIVDLLARARTGAALTAQEEKFYTDQLPGRVGQVGFGIFGVNTQKRIDNFESKINGTLKTKLNGQGAAIQGYSKVKVGGVDRTVGEIIDIGGQQYRVLSDGTLTDII